MEKKPDNSERRRKNESQKPFNLAPDYSDGAKWGHDPRHWLTPTKAEILRAAKKVKIGDVASESDLDKLIKTFVRNPEFKERPDPEMIPGFILPDKQVTHKWEEARDAWILESARKLK